jgi:hypothetical protein
MYIHHIGTISTEKSENVLTWCRYSVRMPAMAKPPPNRKRPLRQITPTPELVEKLLDVGHHATGETNLTRMIDVAIAEYIEERWKPRMRKARLESEESKAAQPK